MKDTFKMIASCPNKDLDIRCMIAKCFYDTPNRVKYDLSTNTVILGGEALTDWRVVTKGKRVRLEYKIGV